MHAEQRKKKTWILNKKSTIEVFMFQKFAITLLNYLYIYILRWASTYCRKKMINNIGRINKKEEVAESILPMLGSIKVSAEPLPCL